MRWRARHDFRRSRLELNFAVRLRDASLSFDEYSLNVSPKLKPLLLRDVGDFGGWFFISSSCDDDFRAFSGSFSLDTSIGLQHSDCLVPHLTHLTNCDKPKHSLIHTHTQKQREVYRSTGVTATHVYIQCCSSLAPLKSTEAITSNSDHHNKDCTNKIHCAELRRSSICGHTTFIPLSGSSCPPSDCPATCCPARVCWTLSHSCCAQVFALQLRISPKELPLMAQVVRLS